MLKRQQQIKPRRVKRVQYANSRDDILNKLTFVRIRLKRLLRTFDY